MKKTVFRLAVVACLLVSVLAIAKNSGSSGGSSGSSTFAGNTDSASYTLRLGSRRHEDDGGTDGTGLFDVTIGASLTDLLWSNDRVSNVYDAPSLIRTLISAAGTQSVSFEDGAGKKGVGLVTLSALGSGKYAFTLTGKWNDQTLAVSHGSGRSRGKGSVELGEVTITPTPLSPVPEPESFAMLLAGLGLVSTVVLRRNKLNRATSCANLSSAHVIPPRDQQNCI